MVVEALRTEEAWLALAGEWDPLVERSASASIFLTLEWLRPWWHAYRRPGEELWILVAREGGATIGLAPLYRSRIRTSYRVGSLRRFGFIGDRTGESEYLDFAIERSREAEVLAAFLGHLDGDLAGWDLGELWRMPKESPNFEPVQRIAAERGCLVTASDWPCQSIELPGSWDAYLGRLQPRFRGKLRSVLRRLPAEHEAAFEECVDPGELPARIESLFDLHQRRWQAEGKPGSFASAARRAFYGEMSEAFLRRGWLRFYTLRLGGRVVAHEFSFEHLGRVHFLQQGYDPACAELSVGLALKAHVIRESIARGAREYDLLGGPEAYKEKWGAQKRWCSFLTLARPALRTRCHLGAPRLVRRLRDWARAVTPGPLLRLKRALQARLRPPKSSGRAERSED